MNPRSLLLASLLCGAVCAHAAINSQTPIEALLKNPVKAIPRSSPSARCRSARAASCSSPSPARPAIVARGNRRHRPAGETRASPSRTYRRRSPLRVEDDRGSNPDRGHGGESRERKDLLLRAQQRGEERRHRRRRCRRQGSARSTSPRCRTCASRCPKSEAGPIRNISDLAFAGDRVLVTGQSNEEFSSKIFSIPLPLGADSHRAASSARRPITSRTASGRRRRRSRASSPTTITGSSAWSARSPARPSRSFPSSDIAAGANIRGTSVVELGSGNRPLDLFAYTKGGQSWIVTNTNRFHQPLFGPSKYWGVRVSTDYLDRNAPEKINENAARRDVKAEVRPRGHRDPRRALRRRAHRQARRRHDGRAARRRRQTPARDSRRCRKPVATDFASPSALALALQCLLHGAARPRDRSRRQPRRAHRDLSRAATTSRRTISSSTSTSPSRCGRACSSSIAAAR